MAQENAMRLLKRFASFFYKRIRVIVLARETQNEAEIPSQIAEPVALIQAQALPALLQQVAHWDVQELARRQHLGDRCYMALEGQFCIHYSWLTQRVRDISEIGYTVEVKDKDVWIYNCYTAPSHRGRSIYPRVLRQIAQQLQSNGGQMMWIDVVAENTPSLHGIKKAGFKEVAILERHILFGCIEVFRSQTVSPSPWAKRFLDMSPTWHPVNASWLWN
jgi:RimJ/RimL family protein N-acetyltransferase